MICITLCLGILLLGHSTSNALITSYIATHYHMKSDSERGKGYVSCSCFGTPKTIRLLNKDMETVFWSVQNSVLCGPDVPIKVCDMLQLCDNCSAGMIKCSSNQTGGDDCFKREIGVFRERMNLIKEPKGMHRHQRRQTHVCRYPEGMENSDLSVKERPNSITIRQKCILGYTLEDGISREMHCSHDENKWKPKRFEECRPFVDCTVDMISTGFATCSIATTKNFSTCMLSCGRHEDKPEVPERRYTCKIDGTWEPRLPYCASPGSGIHLVPAPRIKIHPVEKVGASDKKSTKLTANRWKQVKEGGAGHYHTRLALLFRSISAVHFKRL